MTNVIRFRLPIAPSGEHASRSRRHFDVRAKTESMARMTKRRLALGKLLADTQLAELGDITRPRTRGDCERAERPCPFVSCTHHLYLDVSESTGAIKLNYPDKDVDEIPATCALDIADEGGGTLEVIGATMNITRERVRQLEVAALRNFQSGGGNAHA